MRASEILSVRDLSPTQQKLSTRRNGVAPGEDHPGGDADSLIDLSLDDSGLDPLINLAHELGERVDVTTPEILTPRAARAALAEAIPL